MNMCSSFVADVTCWTCPNLEIICQPTDLILLLGAVVKNLVKTPHWKTQVCYDKASGISIPNQYVCSGKKYTIVMHKRFLVCLLI